MNIEEKIFERSILEEDSLIPYGFKKENNFYILTKQILNNTFKVEITIKNKKVNGKIYDLSFNEEYLGFRNELNTGSFVNSVRESFENILLDIKEKCFKDKYFISNQANIISEMIYKKYKDTPEFMFEKSPTCGVYKNKENNKWYAVIMEINKSKLDKNCNERVEILNVKLDTEKIKKLLEQKSFYKAYHMNKNNWITTLLNNTINNEEILDYIIESHDFTEKSNEWLIPANHKYYNLIEHFQNNNTCLWKAYSNINLNDIIYIYIGVPYQSIMFKLKVIEINKKNNDNIIMNLLLLEKYDENKYTKEILNNYGITNIRGKRSLPKSLSNYINNM